AAILSLVSILIVSCNLGGSNKFINLLGSGSIGGGITLTNRAVHIDTNSATDWYNGVLFDGNNYYISGFQEYSTKKYAIIKLNPDLTLNYAKYYTASGATNIGLTNLWFNPNNSNELFVGGWYNNISGDGIIGKIDKNTGNLNILKIFNSIGLVNLITDSTNLYGVSDNGSILKTDLNLNGLAAKEISGYKFENITQNSNYIATYRFNNNPYGVVIVKKDLSQAIQINTNGFQKQVPLMDNNNNLYLIDKNGSNNLVIAKIDISNISSVSLDMSKEYTWSSLNGIYSEAFLSDGNIVIGITTAEAPRNVIFLKINKDDLSIMNQVKLSAKGGGNSQIVLMTVFPTIDGGFFASRYINSGDVGYAIKMPSDFNLGTNCVFNVSNPNITANNYTYTINTTAITMNDVTITEGSIPTLTEENVSTFVGCMSPAPNVNGNVNGNIGGNRVGDSNIDPVTGRTR
ncbi:MAG: hypothetical protein ACPL1F_06845, partial [bacterium]